MREVGVTALMQISMSAIHRANTLLSLGSLVSHRGVSCRYPGL